MELLRHAQRMETLGRAASEVAHDLNNVLTVIQACGEALHSELPGEGEASEHAQAVLAATARARSLTRDLLAYARRQPAGRETTTLNAVVEGTLPMIRRLVGDEIEVVVVLEEYPWPVRVEPGHFEQALLNLTLNARDAMAGGGVLTIQTQNVNVDRLLALVRELPLPVGRYGMLSVTDTGEGIAAEVAPRIFDPFFTTKAVGRGTGLGLSICKETVELAGGGIAVGSEPGQGTMFSLYVPRSGAAEEARMEEQEPGRVQARYGGDETILVVEDDPAVRKLLVKTLQRYGYEVHAAQDGEDALELAFEVGPFDLVVTDLRMPKLNGYALVELLREHHPKLPVLYITGAPVQGAATRWEEGVDALYKPFSGGDLVLRVRALLDGQAHWH